jgi:DNA-binding MarR family transcriptional regulator
MTINYQDIVREMKRIGALHMSAFQDSLREEHENNMTPLVYCVGDTLFEEPDMKMSEIAKKLSVHLPSITVAVDSMITNGLAEREADPDDRRIVRVQLTLKGRGIIRRMNKEEEKVTNHILSKLSDEEKIQLLTILKKI